MKTDRAIFNLNSNTFGSTKAAEKLVEILNKTNSSFITGKVTHIIGEYKNEIQKLNVIDDKRLKKALLLNRRNYYFDLIEKINGTDDLKSFTKNVISTFYKKSIKI